MKYYYLLSLRFSFLILWMSGFYLQAQEQKKQQMTCGYDPFYIQSLLKKNNRDEIVTRTKNSPASTASVSCGRFLFYIDDISLNVGYGFDDPVLGPVYIQELCDVANYIESVIDIPAGDGSPIEIHIPQSWRSQYGNPVPSNVSPNILALGGPYYSSADFVNNVPGFYGGNAYDHLLSGADPDPGTMDGSIQYNFDNIFIQPGTPACYTVHFFSVTLHEMTHVLGWGSAMRENPSTGLTESIFGNDRFAVYDSCFIYRGTVASGAFTQVIDHSNPGAPSISNGIPAWPFSDHRIWMSAVKQDSLGVNQNCPLFADSTAGNRAPNTISHLYDVQFSFIVHEQYAPGFTPNYVMGPFFNHAQVKSTYTNQELRALRNMGYPFKSSFLTANHPGTAYTNDEVLFQNTHPFTTKPILDTGSVAYNYSADPPFLEADYTISACQTVTIDLSNDAKIKDAEHDPIFIYPGSLYNIRGCGSPGNNHNALTIVSSPSGDQIVYTPPTAFVGRAQFAFELFDGKEKGAYMIYTIDVTPCNSCLGANPNLVVNGSFESGEELLTMNNLTVPNGLQHYRDKKYLAGWSYFIDGVYFPYGGTSVVGQSYACNNSTGQFGIIFNSFNPGWGITPLTGERYLSTSYVNLFQLCSSPEFCKKYLIEFDFGYSSIDPNMPTDSMLLKCGFVDSLPDTFPYYTNPGYNYLFKLMTPPNTWGHFSKVITYCSTDTTHFFVIEPIYGPYFSLYIDNLSIKEYTTAPTFSASIQPPNPIINAGDSITLFATNNDPSLCWPTYYWAPLGFMTSNITVAPQVTTVYTLITTSPCTYAYTTDTVHVIPTVSVSDEENGSAFNCRPNPSNGWIEVELGHSTLQNSSLMLYDALGHQLFEHKMSGVKEIIDMSSFSEGIYLLLLTDPERKTISRKKICISE